jgi:hypothetical protein
MLQVGPAPCGFCGRSGTCKTTLLKKKTSNSIKSDCPFFDKFSYKPAEKPTKGGPCTNRPILCQYPGCSGRVSIWSYNMRDHILASHGQTEYNNVVNLGLFTTSAREIQLLQLDNPFVVPGRSLINLPPISITGTKRPIEDSASIEATLSQAIVQSPIQAQSSVVASGSSSKRARTGQ